MNVSKATQGLSKATSTLSKFSGPLLYNTKVAAQIAKQVYIREGMAPPSGAQFEAAREAALKFIWEARQISRWRHITKDQFLKAGLVTAEAYTFFLVGEIIGRRSFVGYNVESAASQDHHH